MTLVTSSKQMKEEIETLCKQTYFQWRAKQDVYEAGVKRNTGARGMEEEGDMVSQDQNFKYIGSLTEGPSLTSGCGMACCPWTAYACKERKALRRVWQCHTQSIFQYSSVLGPWGVTRTKTGGQVTEQPQLTKVALRESNTAQSLKCEADVCFAAPWAGGLQDFHGKNNLKNIFT